MANSFNIKNGLKLGFVPVTAGGSDSLLFRGTDGSVTALSTLPLNRLSPLTANTVVITDASGFLISDPAVSSTELSYLNGVTSNIQTQLDSKGGAVILTADRAVITNGSGSLAVSPVTAVEIGYLDNASSNIQDQLNTKQATITGGATTIVSSNLSTNFALISNGAGKVAVSTATATELSHLTGASSNIQTQLNSKLTATLVTEADGDIVFRSGGVYTNKPIGTNGQVLTVVGGLPEWSASASNGLIAGGTTNQVLRKVNGDDFNVEWHSPVLADIQDVNVTSTELDLLSGAIINTTELNSLLGVTSNIQTQLENKQPVNLAQNAIWIGGLGNTAQQVPAGVDNSVLTVVGGVPTWQTPPPPGNVTGPGSSTDNAIVRFNGTVGDSIQNSGVIIDDSNNISGLGTISGGQVSVLNQAAVRLYETGSANYVGLRAAGTMASDYTITLPAAAPASDTYLKYDGANYVWSTAAASGTVAKIETFTGNGVDSVFTVTGGTLDQINFVDINGSIQQQGVDYTVAGQDVDFGTALPNGVEITVHYFEGLVVSSSSYSTIEQDGTPLIQRSIINVSNGLIAADDGSETTLKLGGSLTSNTTLDLDSNDLIFSGATGSSNVLFGTSGTPTSELDTFEIFSSNISVTSDTFKWDSVADNLIVGTGTIVSGVRNRNFGDNTSITGSWVFTSAESATIYGNNSISGGWTHEIGDGVNFGSGSGTATFGVDHKNYGRNSHISGIGGQIDNNNDLMGGFVHAFNSPSIDGLKPTGIEYVLATDGAFNVSQNTVAQTAGHGAMALLSVILGGRDHNIPSDSPRSAIIGGNAIKARDSEPDNVYVPYFNITEIDQDDLLTQVIVRDDTTGKIHFRDASTFGGGGGGGGGFYQTIQQDGSSLTQRATLNVLDGLTAVDDGSSKTTLSLGGTLTQNITIDNDGNDLEFIGTFGTVTIDGHQVIANTPGAGRAALTSGGVSIKNTSNQGGLILASNVIGGSETFQLPTSGGTLAGTNSTQTFTATQTFSGVRLHNPAKTFYYEIVPSAIVANRNVTLPLLTGNDTFVMNSFAATLTSKTLGSGTVFSVAPTINDGIKFTFNPNATVSGLNVGANGGNPSSPVDGDIYYDSNDAKFIGRQDGSWFNIIQDLQNVLDIGAYAAIGGGLNIAIGDGNSDPVDLTIGSSGGGAITIHRESDNNYIHLTTEAPLTYEVGTQSLIGVTYPSSGAFSGVAIEPFSGTALSRTFIDANYGFSSGDTGEITFRASQASDILTLQGNGTTSAIGFFGVSPAPQQSFGAATAGAIYTSTEQDMLQKVYDALRTFGFGD